MLLLSVVSPWFPGLPPPTLMQLSLHGGKVYQFSSEDLFFLYRPCFPVWVPSDLLLNTEHLKRVVPSPGY